MPEDTHPLTSFTDAAAALATGFEVQSFPGVMHSLKTTMLSEHSRALMGRISHEGGLIRGLLLACLVPLKMSGPSYSKALCKSDEDLGELFC